MTRFLITIIFAAAFIAGSCSRKSVVDERSSGDRVTNESKQESSREASAKEGADENESAPEEQDIGEDCVAFVRATVAKRSESTPGQCPVCPSSAEHAEVLRFVSYKIERISPGASACEVTVRIRTVFNPSNGGAISGGLVGWIPAPQKEQYARGESPSGEQTYEVKIIYRRSGEEWRPIEFDRTAL